MNDNQIRSALKQKLFVQYFGDRETLILEEMGIRHGAARIDLVVVNGTLNGFEIKSDCDTLKRLPNQIRLYNSVLDRITLVVGHRHVDEAMQIVPEWWGVKIAKIVPNSAIHFTNIRAPRNNPSPDIIAIAKLLWRNEALAFLEKLGVADGLRSKPRAAIYARLAEVVALDSLRMMVRQQLKCRIGWRSAERRVSYDD